MKRFAFLPLLILLLVASCGKKPEGPSPHEIDRREARAAAESYYALLAAGKWSQYVAAIHDCDSMSPEYRRQMADIVAQYGAEEKARRGGIVKAKAVADTVGTAVADIRLALTYGDSTQEQVSVALVKANGRWRLR